QAGTRYPLAVLPHGGPEGISFDGWNTRPTYPAQLFATRGYVVFMPNYRGSAGRGSAFAMSDHLDLGGAEFQDVLAGIDQLVADGLVDDKRVGMGGWSYGGYFSALAATTYSDRFGATMIAAAITDWVSFTGTTEIEHENSLVHWKLWPWDDLDALPAPLSPLHGSNDGMGGDPFVNCDGVNDCSDSLLENWNKGDGDPNDKTWFSFDVTVPPLVYGFEFDFVFFSSEYPDFVGEAFNDMFIAWSTSELFTGNISFFDGKPLTVTSLATAIDSGYSGNAPELAGTGFENRAGTTWVRINQPIMENVELELYFFLADMGDTALASAVIIDRFRFSCDECIPADDPQCTGEVPDPNCCGVVLPM
ncbi:MAG: S9 family peptidase, partial [Myxococcales bacterium]|nr:S9 family peptidase [Myxococcales bacterium]